MEILPHFWITYYNENLNIIKEKKIKNIIHLSKQDSFFKIPNVNEIKIHINYNDQENYEEMNNIMYDHLFDITEYLHNKIINNESILLLGIYDRQDIDVIIIAYYIRYGHLTIQESVRFLKTKKDDIFDPKCLFYSSLNKFYYQLNKNY
jgi:hypothetical protein